MTRILLLGPAREAAGTKNDVLEGVTVSDILDAAVTRYGQSFAEILAVSQVWVNGDVADLRSPVGPDDEVEVLPPISGG
jgi:molybdopterin synthase sulfur carrier subunit